jgi:hypothetical protein
MKAVFLFTVHRLRWLIRAPFFPQFFDSLLLAWTCLAHRPRLAAITALESAVDGRATLAVHRFGGIEFLDAQGRELGHVHGHGLLDVRLQRPRARELIAQGLVQPHHIFPNSGWVSFPLETTADVPFALALLGLDREMPSVQRL